MSSFQQATSSCTLAGKPQPEPFNAQAYQWAFSLSFFSKCPAFFVYSFVTVGKSKQESSSISCGLFPSWLACVKRIKNFFKSLCLFGACVLTSMHWCGGQRAKLTSPFSAYTMRSRDQTLATGFGGRHLYLYLPSHFFAPFKIFFYTERLFGPLSIPIFYNHLQALGTGWMTVLLLE